MRTLLEVQTTSGSNSAGKIYIDGNFTDAGGNAKMDYLIRVNANHTGGVPNTGFYPTDTGLSTGMVSYTNCIQTMFTAEGSGSSLNLVIGTQSRVLSKKLFVSGADAAGFTSPTFISQTPVTTGFSCTSGCGGKNYVMGGGFTTVNSNAKLARLVRLNTDG